MKTKSVCLCIALLALLSACQQNPTPTIAALDPTIAPPSDTPAPPTATPIPPTATDEPSATPSPTVTPSPVPTSTPTPEPVLALRLVNEDSGEPLNDAEVLLTGLDTELTLELHPAAGGWLHVTGLTPADYTLTVTATGYTLSTQKLTTDLGETELIVEVAPQPLALVTSETANLRGGPDTVYAIVGQAVEGDQLPLAGRNEDGSWLLVLDANGEPAWVAATLVETSSDPQELAAATPPPTPEATATPEVTATPEAPVVAAPAGGSGTLGPNLLVNPGFEEGNAGWILTNDIYGIIGLVDDPEKVYSGAHALAKGGDYLTPLYQLVPGVTPGQTYRLGAWVRLETESPDTFYPDEPSYRTYAYICLNSVGIEDFRDSHTVCSPWVEPWNGWIYLTVDAVAEGDRLAVMLLHHRHHDWHVSRFIQNYALYDDVYLGVVN